jgi:hypothetical protein
VPSGLAVVVDVGVVKAGTGTGLPVWFAWATACPVGDRWLVLADVALEAAAWAGRLAAARAGGAAASPPSREPAARRHATRIRRARREENCVTMAARTRSLSCNCARI